MLCAVNLFAQVIPNADMEAWEDSGSFEEPAGWNTTNPLVITVTKTTDAYQGQYAALLESKSLVIITVAGVMATGDIVPEELTVKGGFPINQPYTNFSGFYKYTPSTDTSSGEDTCWMAAILTKWNTTNNARDTVAMANFYGGAAANYTFFDVPLNYIAPELPDTALIIVFTTRNPLGGPAGSKLYVDDLSLSGGVGINLINEYEEVSIYPSPVSDNLVITLANTSQAKQVIVSDLLGNKVGSYIVNSDKVNVNTTSFANGIYFIELLDDSRNVLATKKFSVKH
jgi:hypothetical protein